MPATIGRWRRGGRPRAVVLRSRPLSFAKRGLDAFGRPVEVGRPQGRDNHDADGDRRDGGEIEFDTLGPDAGCHDGLAQSDDDDQPVPLGEVRRATAAIPLDAAQGATHIVEVRGPRTTGRFWPAPSKNCGTA